MIAVDSVEILMRKSTVNRLQVIGAYSIITSEISKCYKTASKISFYFNGQDLSIFFLQQDNLSPIPQLK